MQSTNKFRQTGLSQEEKAELAAKWGFLTEGMEKPDYRLHKRKIHVGRTDPQILAEKKEMVEHMLEVQEAYCEGLAHRQSQVGMLQESTTTSDISSFQTVALTTIQKVYPRLIAPDLFNIIPITQPGGKVFTIDHQRDPAGTSLAAKASFSTSYAEASEGSSVPLIKQVITSANISMYTKKLRSVTSIEALQDLWSYYGINGDQALLNAKCDEIVREIDYKMLTLTVAGATGGNVDFVTTPPDGLDQVNLKAYNRTLYDAIIDGQNLVYAKRFRKPNWVASGIAETARLEKCEEFKLSPGASDGDHSIGRHYLGTIDRRTALYCDPWWQDANKYLIGYRGQDEMDVAAVFSPYVGLYITPNQVEPNTLDSRRAAMSRFGFTITLPDCFATVTLVASL